MKLKFGIIPKKKVSVSDIKQYLVDEYKNNENMQKQIYKLQDELKDKVTIQIKYETTLVTLDEYKNRLKAKDDRIKELDNQIKNLNKKIKSITDEKNSEILNYKKLNKLYDSLKNNFDKEVNKKISEKLKDYKNTKINEITNLKGHIRKDDVVRMLGDK